MLWPNKSTNSNRARWNKEPENGYEVLVHITEDRPQEQSQREVRSDCIRQPAHSNFEMPLTSHSPVSEDSFCFETPKRRNGGGTRHDMKDIHIGTESPSLYYNQYPYFHPHTRNGHKEGPMYDHDDLDLSPDDFVFPFTQVSSRRESPDASLSLSGSNDYDTDFNLLRTRTKSMTSNGTEDTFSLEQEEEEDDLSKYEDEDDDNSCSRDVYDRVSMQISKVNGIITLHYAHATTTAAIDSPSYHPTSNRHNHKLVNITDSNQTEFAHSTSLQIPSLLPLNNPTVHSSDDSLQMANIPPPFELAVTNHRADTEQIHQKHQKIRLTVLNVAADAYKNLNLDVPDILLAQMNKTRNTLKADKGMLPILNDFERLLNVNNNVQKQKHNHNNNEHLTKEATKHTELLLQQPRKISINDLNRINKIKKPFQNSSVTHVDNGLPIKNKIRKIKLSEFDEIHCSPCQCALTLVGMQGMHTLSPQFCTTISEGNDDYMEATIGRTIFGFGETYSPEKERTPSLHKENNFKQSLFSSSTHQLSSGSRALNNSLHLTLPSGLKRRQSNSASEMVRTVSAEAARVNVACDRTKKNEHTNNNNNNNVFKTHNRNASNTFSSIGYHELTLIRNQKKDESDHAKIEQQSDFEYVNWDALTIRCRDHDEMDILVRALKSSSKANVVPFSSNPKSKIKKKKVIYKRQQKARRSRQIKQRSISWKSPRSPTIRKEHNFEKGISKSEDELVVQKEMENAQQCDEPATKFKLGWNFVKKSKNGQQFNNNHYCELCHLHFTLLTRRHHCRKCDRSCCGDCSSLMLVKGGDETRFCNVCSSDILRKQSKALRDCNKLQAQSTDIPGKVHEECHRLGVGVWGKLPHWKNYLSIVPSRRPAVGRISIEIIEAMALPSVDMVNYKVDSYIRATITGYDLDMRWNLKEWLPSKRYSLCSTYCSSTLSPQWRGPGLKGGELLTLPVISTAGAVLRLEVLHYDVMTNSRGKDVVLGLVEIPLSDISNANLRRPEGQELTLKQKRRKKKYDGYCDRWYRLHSPCDQKDETLLLSKPITSPHHLRSGQKRRVPENKNHSLEEIGKRLQGLCVAPIEWIGTALQLDLPRRRPETIFHQHRARSKVHVRIKLNASEVGDLLSHTWFPPVEPYPPIPTFDPQTLWDNILLVSKLTEPYRDIFKFIEDCIKWRLEQNICAASYFVFAFHLILFQYILHILHIHLMVFLAYRLWLFNKRPSKEPTDAVNSLSLHNETSYGTANENDMSVDSNDDSDTSSIKSNSVVTLGRSKYNSGVEVLNSPSVEQLNKFNNFKPSSLEQKMQNDDAISARDEDEAKKLHKAIRWLAKRIGNNKGLEILQFKLGLLAKDLSNLNSLWDGSSTMKTKIFLAILPFSFIIHCFMKKRLVWLVGTATVYFARCPSVILLARTGFGFWRGMAKAVRRRQLHEMEVSEHYRLQT